MGNITVRLAPGFTDSLGCATEPAASSRLTMPLLAFNRKDRGGEWTGAQSKSGSSAATAAGSRQLPDNAASVAVSWPSATATAGVPVTQLWLHRLIIGASAALRRNPGDVAVGVL